ncbi:hypothetical protein [Agromyces archimandritae]|uniref:YtxH domain-containing protein n=1 Tax=Agromyces archimandritae TaxID=2781962 RepID=A0A975IMH0_9MICO|nr:hypothetical protein [Agromyces archimandritae]QTX03440.1 hypothetical protein G127AT_08660 [Agromyces archimandritae]
MKGKLLFVVGLGIGYVLGTRAGRQRYEQIASAAKNVWNTPAVQQGVETVKDFALERVGDVSDSVLDGVKRFVRSTADSQRDAKADVGKAAKAAKRAVDDAADELEDAIDAAAASAEAAAGKVSSAAKQAKQRSSSSKTSSTRAKPAGQRGTRKND